MGLEPLKEKWSAFGWEALEIDGHDLAAIGDAFKKAKAIKGRPTIIIAHTIKGKGVSFMENVPSWHGSLKLSTEDLTTALVELGADQPEIERAING